MARPRFERLWPPTLRSRPPSPSQLLFWKTVRGHGFLGGASVYAYTYIWTYKTVLLGGHGEQA